MDAMAISLRSVAAHERDHKGNIELAGVIDGAADKIEKQSMRIAVLEQIIFEEVDVMDCRDAANEMIVSQIAKKMDAQLPTAADVRGILKD